MSKFNFSERNPGGRWFHQLQEKAGQHSLVIYLVHQPVMFGTFLAIERLL